METYGSCKEAMYISFGFMGMGLVTIALVSPFVGLATLLMVIGCYVTIISLILLGYWIVSTYPKKDDEKYNNKKAPPFSFSSPTSSSSSNIPFLSDNMPL